MRISMSGIVGTADPSAPVGMTNMSGDRDPLSEEVEITTPARSRLFTPGFCFS
jgi:hypothetical protein